MDPNTQPTTKDHVQVEDVDATNEEESTEQFTVIEAEDKSDKEDEVRERKFAKSVMFQVDEPVVINNDEEQQEKSSSKSDKPEDDMMFDGISEHSEHADKDKPK